MKVLWLASWYPNRQDNSTGDFIQRHAQAVALYCNVHVIYVMKDENLSPGSSLSEKFESNNLTEEIIYYNTPRTRINLFDRFLSYKSYERYYTRAIQKYINEYGKPDLVHLHVAMKAGLAALWMKRKWNIPFIITEHWTGYQKESRPSVYDHDPVFRRLNKRILKEAKILLPVTKDLGERINLFLPAVPYYVIPNVVNTAIFKYQPAAPGKFRFIHISYMNFQKNPDGILKAAQLLKARGYDFELLMLGRKNESLTALADKYGLLPDTVFFQRAVPYAEVAGFIQNASAFLLFSRFENLPCVILEALCCGLPVISSNVGGISEAVNDENGILVENKNIEALVNAMQKMIDDYNSFNREKIAAEASAKYNYATVGRQIVEFYK